MKATSKYMKFYVNTELIVWKTQKSLCITYIKILDSWLKTLKCRGSSVYSIFEAEASLDLPKYDISEYYVQRKVSDLNI